MDIKVDYSRRIDKRNTNSLSPGPDSYSILKTEAPTAQSNTATAIRTVDVLSDGRHSSDSGEDGNSHQMNVKIRDYN